MSEKACSIGPGGLAQDVFAEGVNPIWLENLKRCPGIEEFKSTYVREQTIRKQAACKVHQVVLRKSTSLSGASLACKSFERQDDRGLERWALEMAIHTTLSGHPHIVEFHGAYFSELSLIKPAGCNLLMELCRESLWDFMSFWHQVDLKDVQLFAKDMCMGLQHIHQCSVLHRDMKPGNCLLQHVPGQRVVLKICDFGNSVFLTRVDEQRFPASKKLAPLMTTYRYSSPEICKLQPYEYSSDMWSTGVIIWELLQEHVHVPAIAFDQEREGLQGLEPAVTLFCCKVDHRRRTGSSTSIEELALELLEVAAETRPTATEAVSKLASMGPRDAKPADAVTPMGLRGGELASMGPRDAKPADAVTPMGLRGGEQQGVITGGGAKDAGGGLALDLNDNTVLAWAVKLKAYLDIPGDVTAFVEAAQKLDAHRGNVLLLSILARAKYPTVVQDLAVRFSTMPVPFTACALKQQCHAGIRHAASVNESKALQREMLLYDDQRMGCHMGLARVMEKLGLIRASTTGTKSGSTFALGHGKPRKQYMLAYEKGLLQKVVQDLGHTHTLQLMGI